MMELANNMNYSSYADCTVCMIVANAVRGDSRVIKSAQALHDKGFHVHLFGMNRKPVSVELDEFDFPVTLVPNPAKSMHKDKVYYNSEQTMDIDVFVTRLAKNMNAAFGATQFDFLHTHDMYGLPIGARIREKNKAIGELGWIHDIHEYVEGCTHIPESKRLAALKLEQTYIQAPDSLTTVSPILADIMVNDYKVPKPSLVLNTPKLTDFKPDYPRTIRQSLNLNPDTFLLVYCGNVKPERGVNYAVEALELMPDVHLALLTTPGTPYIEELKTLAGSLGVADRLHVHPYVDNSDVSSFLQDANAGVRPSTLYANADLALDTKLFEYIHAGLPIVSSGTTAMTQFITKHNCGLLFPIGDVKALASAILQIKTRFPNGLKNTAEGSELAQAYCWEAQVKRLIGHYEALIHQHLEASKPAALNPQALNEIQAKHPANLTKFYLFWQRQGDMFASKHDFGNAILSYQKAIELNEKDFSSLIKLSRLVAKLRFKHLDELSSILKSAKNTLKQKALIDNETYQEALEHLLEEAQTQVISKLQISTIASQAVF